MPTPFQQGCLDGLCGLYACVNAASFLEGGYSAAEGKDLVEHIVEHYEDIFPHFFHKGMYLKHLWPMARFTAEETGLNVSRPFARRSVESAEEFFDILAPILDGESAIALLGLGHPMHHWTLAKRVTDKTVSFYDSGNLTRMRRSSFALETGKGKTKIDYKQTIVFKQP